VQDDVPPDAPKLLKAVHGKRQYLLPYHRMFQAHAPALLEAYDAYYTRLTLEPRHLTPQERETVWIALQAAAREAHGTIHLRRAEAAGLDGGRIADSLAIAAAVEAWPALAFGHDEWGEWLPRTATLPRYLALFEAARGATPSAIAEITAVVCHAARRTQEGLALHLPRAFAAGATPAQAAEGLSYLLLPCGGPTLIDAVATWARAAETDARLPAPY
jgi:alkylhydroperoxidase/carboxymuconolactone decarboxylase family protein YurZ